MNVGWVDCTQTTEVLSYYKPETRESPFTGCWTVKENFCWQLHSYGQQIRQEFCILLESLPTKITTISDVEKALVLLSNVKVCQGNPDERFQSLSKARKGCFMDSTGKWLCKYFILYNTLLIILNNIFLIILHNNLYTLHIGTHTVAQDTTSFGISTIRHVKCDLLIESTRVRCSQCMIYRKALHAYLSRQKSASSGTMDRTAPNSHVNCRYLTTTEKCDRLKRLHQLQRSTRLRTDRVKRKLTHILEENSVVLDDDTHNDITEVMIDSTPHIAKCFPKNSFQRLFWEQQQKAMQVKDSRSIKWHPLMIKWCLYLRHLSGKAYETLRESGTIRLPSQRTLRDYTHCVNSTAGFSAALDRHLMEVADVNACPEFKKNVVIIMDEMYIKEDLVFNKVSGELVGFSNLGDINSHLLQFQSSLEQEDSQEQLAKTMLVFMVRGLFSSLEFLYVQLPCTTVTGDLLFDPLWEAIARLERCGLKVLAVTADGASSNRHLFKIHNPSSSTEITYKVKNPYAADGRSVHFLSDPPHLMKTVRNCLASKSRKLWVSYVYVILLDWN